MAIEFTLRFPFEISPNRKISGIDKSFEQKIGRLKFCWEQQNHFQIIKVSGFDSELNAQEYSNKIWIGLMWVTLNRNIAFSLNKDFGKVDYFSDSKQAGENLSRAFGLSFDEKEVDGLADGDAPVVYQSNKKIQFISAGNVNAILGKPVDQIFTTLIEGIALANNLNIISNTKLIIALELYSAYYYESSANAKLLTLVMALEALTSNSMKSQFILEIIADWQNDVDQRKTKLDSNSKEFEELVSLERELLFRKEKSLRSQIKELVFDTLQKTGALDAKEMSLKALKVYDSRSTLVHEGTLTSDDLNWAVSEAKKIVEEVLKVKLTESN